MGACAWARAAAPLFSKSAQTARRRITHPAGGRSRTVKELQTRTITQDSGKMLAAQIRQVKRDWRASRVPDEVACVRAAQLRGVPGDPRRGLRLGNANRGVRDRGAHRP